MFSIALRQMAKPRWIKHVLDQNAVRSLSTFQVNLVQTSPILSKGSKSEEKESKTVQQKDEILNDNQGANQSKTSKSIDSATKRNNSESKSIEVNEGREEKLFSKIDLELRAHQPAVLKSYVWFISQVIKRIKLCMT